jgi:hypothetical protein
VVLRASRMNNAIVRTDTITIEAQKGRIYYEVYNTIKP